MIEPVTRSYNRPLELLVWVLVVGSSSLLLATQYWPLALVCATALFLLVVIGRWPAAGFLLFVALLPFEGFTALSPGHPYLTVSKILGAVLVVIMAVRLLIDRDSLLRLKSRFWPWMLALLAVSLVSALLSEFPVDSANGLRRLLTSYLVFALACFFIEVGDLKAKLPLLIVASVSLGSVLSVLGWIFELPYFVATTRIGDGVERSIGTQTDANFFASTIVFSLPFLLHFMFSARRSSARLLVLLLAMFSFAALVITYSRAGAAIAVVTFLLFLGSRLTRFRPRFLPVVIAGVLAVLLALLALVPASYWERQVSITEIRSDAAVSRRLSYLTFGWQAFLENPVVGSGPGSFRQLYARSPFGPAYEKEGQPLQRAAHNGFVEIAVGTGTLGIIAFLMILLTAFRNFRRYRAALPEKTNEASDLWTAYGLAFLSLVLFSFFLSNQYVEYLWISLAISQIGSRSPNRD